MPSLSRTANFGFLERYDEALVNIAALAERYFPDDPVTSVMKTRELGELPACSAEPRHLRPRAWHE
jgi:type I restriction enzyme R subunit